MARTATRRALSALPTSIAMHAWLALLAAATAGLIGAGLTQLQVPSGDLNAAIELGSHMPALALTWLSVLGLVALLLVLMSPCLRLGWLRALSTGDGARESFAFGLRLVGQALAQSGLVLGVGLLGLLPFAGLCWLWLEWLKDRPEHTQLTAVALIALPACGWLLVWAVWQDLAAAALAQRGRLVMRDLRVSLRQALRLGALWSFVSHAALALGFGGAAIYTMEAQSGLMGLTAAQLLLVGRTLTRSRWLGRASILAEDAQER